MSYMTDINAAIAGLDKWQRVALAAMCATSVSPVVTYFAQPATRRAFEEGLDAIWKSVRGGTVDSDIVTAREGLNDLPESDCDDSNIPAHDVMEALSILAYALGALIENDSERWARYSCTEAASSYGGYDYVLAYGNQVRKIDPRNPPPPGRLELLQIQLQLRSIEAMRKVAQLENQIVEQMRTSAVQLASELARALPTYAEQRGWDIHPKP